MTGLPTAPRTVPSRRDGSQSAPQRLSLRIVTLTLGDSGMSAQRGGLLAARAVADRLHEVGRLASPFVLLAGDEDGRAPAGPLVLRALERREEQVLPFLAFGAGGDLVGRERRPWWRTPRRSSATSLLFSFWQRMKSNAFAGAYFCAQTWKRSPFTSFGPCIELGSPPWLWPMYSTCRSTSGPNLATTSLNAASACTPYGHWAMTCRSTCTAPALTCFARGARGVGGDARRAVREPGVDAPHDAGAGHETESGSR